MAERLIRQRYTMFTEDVAREYGYTIETVRVKVRRNQIPCVKIGGRLKFDPDEVERALVRRLDTERGMEERITNDEPVAGHPDEEYEFDDLDLDDI